VNIRTNLIFLETRVIGLHFPLTVRVYLLSNFSAWLRKTIFSAKVRFDRSRSPKVIDFGTHRTLHRFGDIAGFCAHDPTLFHPNFWGVPVGPDHHVGVSPSINLKSAVKLFSKYSDM